MTMWRQNLVWTPRAKQRARTVMQGGRHVTYTPRQTRDAEADLARQWVGPPIEGDISLQLFLSDTAVEVVIEQIIQPTSAKLRRGDIDNYTKLILDGLNGHAWIDDRQIGGLQVIKL